MHIETLLINDTKIAEVTSDKIVLHTIEEGADLFANLYYQGFDKVILYKSTITPNFFELKNGMAGEILQKISNFRMQLVIVGDFSDDSSNSIKAFIIESNKGKQVNFLSSKEEAIATLTRI